MTNLPQPGPHDEPPARPATPPAGVDVPPPPGTATVPQQPGPPRMPTGGYPMPGQPGAPTEGYGTYGDPTVGHGPGYPGAPTAAYGSTPTSAFPGQGPPPWGYGAPPPQRPPRRRGPIIVALVAAFALVAGSIIVYQTFFSRGGDTPTEAVQLLTDDLADGNYLSAVSRLHPAEVDLISDTNDILTPELERLGIIKPGADLEMPSGGLTVSGLRFDPTEERVRDGGQTGSSVAIMKLVGGTITIGQDPASFPFTDSFRNRVFPNGVPASAPMTIDIADLGEPVRVATVEVDGNWYVSVFYTIADIALQESNMAWPLTTITPRGGSTADEALRATVVAVSEQDVRRLVELAPPGELSVLHEVGDAIPLSSGRGLGFSVVELQTSETTVDGETALGIDRLVLQNSRGQTGSITRNGSCLVVQESGRSSQEQVCPDDLLRDWLGQSATTSPQATRAATAVMGALLDVKFVVIKADDDDKWYVSPTRTAIGLYASLLRALQPGDVEALLDAG